MPKQDRPPISVQVTNSRKYKYGVTSEDFERMFKKQGGRCAICSDKFYTKAFESSVVPCVDHDHETGVVRGLLCRTCNGGIGLFYESIRRLSCAIVYLEDHGKTF